LIPRLCEDAAECRSEIRRRVFDRKEQQQRRKEKEEEEESASHPTSTSTKNKTKQKTQNKGLLLRAAFHDAGTYNPSAPAGTSQGGENCFSTSSFRAFFPPRFDIFFFSTPRPRPPNRKKPKKKNLKKPKNPKTKE